jgi:hypothetical protein
MPICPPRRESVVGTFKAGELFVGERTWADAVCGIPVCGDAICGTIWAEVCNPGLALGAYAPSILAPTVQAPPAGLGLGANLPILIVQTTVHVPYAALAFGTQAPGLKISLTLRPQPAGLGLGTYRPDFYGWERLLPAECIPGYLAEADAQELELVPAPCD